MPSQFDFTYNDEYAEPTYDSKEDKIKYQTIREAEYSLEMKPPREPTREEELEYIEW